MTGSAELYVVASQRPWNAGLADRLARRTGRKFMPISKSSELSADAMGKVGPRYIFFAHWSDRIPEEVWRGFECVIFHMTDVPYGRGGSPLQNLILRGRKTTVISAIRCVEDFDAGPVYLKKPLPLSGSAEEIFVRADRLIEEMIVQMIESHPEPRDQTGEVTVFKRLGPDAGNLKEAATLDEWFDRIRMLDAEGYPHAFLDVGNLRLRFRSATLEDGQLEARVVITERGAEGKS